DAFVMTYVHVSHNVTVGTGVVLTSGVQLGGHSSVGEHAVLGASAHLHQFTRVGEYAILGAMAGANRDVLPFTMAHGLVAEHYGLNKVGLQRNGITGERYELIQAAYRALRRRDSERFEE